MSEHNTQFPVVRSVIGDPSKYLITRYDATLGRQYLVLCDDGTREWATRVEEASRFNSHGDAYAQCWSRGNNNQNKE